MPKIRGQSFDELQYVAQNLIESTIDEIEWEKLMPFIRVATRDDEDAKTVLALIDKATITVEFLGTDE
jgi:hypothetical protein